MYFINILFNITCIPNQRLKNLPFVLYFLLSRKAFCNYLNLLNPLKTSYLLNSILCFKSLIILSNWDNCVFNSSLVFLIVNTVLRRLDYNSLAIHIHIYSFPFIMKVRFYVVFFLSKTTSMQHLFLHPWSKYLTML